MIECHDPINHEMLSRSWAREQIDDFCPFWQFSYFGRFYAEWIFISQSDSWSHSANFAQLSSSLLRALRSKFVDTWRSEMSVVLSWVRLRVLGLAYRCLFNRQRLQEHRCPNTTQPNQDCLSLKKACGLSSRSWFWPGRRTWSIWVNFQLFTYQTIPRGFVRSQRAACLQKVLVKNLPPGPMNLNEWQRR